MEDITYDSLFDLVIKSRLETMHQGLPAKIITYDPEQQRATVQPLIQYRDRSAGVDAKGLQDRPLIQNIPVIFPSAGTGILTFPIVADPVEGDIVALFFVSVSTNNFVYSDGRKTVDPQDYSLYDYNDCYAVTGLYPFQKALGSHPSDTVIRMNVGTDSECKISLKPNGDVVVDSPNKVIVNGASEVEVNTTVVKINASSSVTIDSPQTTITGELRVDGGVSVGSDVQTDAGFSANNHKHIGNLSKPTSTFI